MRVHAELCAFVARVDAVVLVLPRKGMHRAPAARCTSCEQPVGAVVAEHGGAELGAGSAQHGQQYRRVGVVRVAVSSQYSVSPAPPALAPPSCAHRTTRATTARTRASVKRRPCVKPLSATMVRWTQQRARLSTARSARPFLNPPVAHKDVSDVVRLVNSRFGTMGRRV